MSDEKPKHRRSNEIDADGKRWKLAGYPATDNETINEIADQNARGRYEGYALNIAAIDLLITANPELDVDAACEIINQTDIREIIEAVENSIFPTENREHSYLQWIRSGLLANGIDPDKTPRADWLDIMEHLEYTRRIKPAEKFIDGLRAAAYRARLLKTLASND